MRVQKLLGGAAAAIAMTGLAMPASAQRWHPERRHHEDKFDVGDAIVGGLVVGGLIALVSSGKKKPPAASEAYADVPPPEARTPIDTGPMPEGRYAGPAESGAAGAGPIAPTPAPDSARFDGLYDEDAAADACAIEAESMGERYARLARVSSVTSTVWNGKSWVIKGQVELADSYRDTSKQSYGFRCALKRGSDPIVTIAGLASL